MKFQSTLPVGGATSAGNVPVDALEQFQSTLPVGGATHQHPGALPLPQISIHAPRGGSDTFGIR